MSLVASDFGTGQVFLSMLWFFLFFIWIWLLIMVFSDIFRSQDLSGGLKAVWVIFVVIMPYLGVFVYLIARGGKMHEHAVQTAQAQDAAARAYIQNAVTTGTSATDQIAQLSNLKAQGVIDDAEFQKMKAKVVDG
jgi:hypothetical protein